MKLTLSRKLYGGFGVVLAILAVLVAAALFSTDRLVESKTASQRSYDTVQRALELENQLANISIGIRGFMLTGKEDMLSAVYAGDGEVEKTLKTLRANLADRVAAFGGAIVLNRVLDRDTAELILQQYAEVVAAPDFAPGDTVRFIAFSELLS